MKPMIILPPDTMSAKDIEALRDNGICVVESKDPALVKFVDPIPCAAGRTKVEQAAIELSRILLNNQWGEYNGSTVIGRDTFAQIFCDLILKGTPLGRGVQAERLAFDSAKLDEIRKMGREEARAERAAKKQAQQPQNKEP